MKLIKNGYKINFGNELVSFYKVFDENMSLQEAKENKLFMFKASSETIEELKKLLHDN
jgi:hypothetical protein